MVERSDLSVHCFHIWMWLCRLCTRLFQVIIDLEQHFPIPHLTDIFHSNLGKIQDGHFKCDFFDGRVWCWFLYTKFLSLHKIWGSFTWNLNVTWIWGQHIFHWQLMQTLLIWIKPNLVEGQLMVHITTFWNSGQSRRSRFQRLNSVLGSWVVSSLC